MTPAGPEIDNAKYNGTLTGTSTALRAAINNNANWITNDGPPFDLTPTNYPSPSVTCAAPCTDPDIPTVSSAPGIICDGNSALLTISGDKGDATQWSIYTGSCGGTLVGTTAGSTIIVTPTPPSTTYFIRGEGGCVTPGSCATITVTTTAREDATFNYSAAAYCVNGTDPSPTVSGVGGGSFSSVPGGLSLNGATGQIDLSASTPNTYTVTYTTGGLCAGSESVSVTINALDNASFSYSAATYCVSDGDPTPTITGLGGGTFSAGAGLSINTSTGAIDVSLSTPGTYTVTYTTVGACPNSASATVIINGLDDASFSYSAATYCAGDTDPTPTVTGLGGGTFSAGAGLSINASTGAIDVSASTPGTYTVTYTTSGACPNSSSVSVTINALDNASFSYSAAAYCVSDSDPTPTITGLGAGTFSAGAGLSINTSTGAIDVSLSTPGTYTVTYTTVGACPNSASATVTINGLDDASFSYSAATYCAGDTDPTPTVTGLGGGTFSAGAGLSINASTGAIDVSASTPGTYTVTYTTSGACPNSSSVSVTINALDNASFSYSAATYCVSDSDPTPTITGLGGGTFSAGAGLSINASTGAIDVSLSTPGTYTVTYTTVGACPNSASATVTINGLDDASFSYSAATYCPNGSDPTPVITGLAGGSFTSSPVGLVINATTGEIDLDGSTIGTYTITYTTAGACPNTSAVTVTIEDTEAPVVDVITLPTLTAQCEVTSLTAPTATDNCSGAITGIGDAVLPITESTTITWTYTDESGNEVTQEQNVVVDDTTPPVADAATLPTLTGECEITSLVAPTATDNCGDFATVNNDATLPITASTTITWTYTDMSGNASTQTQNVIIDDMTPPVADLATLPTLTDECEIATLVTPSATDNCGALIVVSNDVTLPITESTTITWTYTDAGGNTSTQTQSVVIDDVTAPVADAVTLPTLTDECEISTLVTPSATDNCGGTVTVSNDVTLPLTASTTITWTYTDEDGNASTQTQSVVIDDVTAPVADAVTLPTLTDECEISTLVTPSATDNCGGTVTVSNDVTLPLTASTTITWTYTDEDGNASTQTQSVEINDVTAPSPDVVTLPTLTAECEITSLVAPTATDNCGGAVTVSNDAILPITTSTTITWTYTDESGNSTSQTQTVEINDETDPVIDFDTLDDVVAECELTSLVPPTATDNCADEVIVTSDAVLPITELGTTEVTWTFDDGNGNVITETQNVIVNDLNAPTPDTEILAAITAECEVTVLDEPTATDNCGGVVTITNDAILPLTESTTITWTYTDESGNATVQTQDVLIEDITAPVADVEVLTTLTDECEITELDMPTATDNCAGEVTVTSDVVLPITESTTINWTYTDESGNTAVQTQEVFIEDITAPVPDIDELPDLFAECEIATIETLPTATDNCAGEVIVTNDATFPITASTIITWTFTDESGNAITQSQAVLIEDITAPTPAIELLEDIVAECEVTTLETPAATDNCVGSVTVTNDATLPITESTTITWTYTDETGNAITQTQSVIIDDVTPPMPDEEILPTIEVTCALEEIETAPTATDNCAGVVAVINDATLPITESTTITWTFTDESGNTTVQTQEVIVSPIDVSTTIEGTIVIQANNSDADSYQWIDCLLGDVEIPGETNQTFEPTENGTYAVVISQGICSDTSDCVEITSIGIDENEALNVVIYPNPVTAQQFTVSTSAKITAITVVDMSGRVVEVNAELATGTVKFNGVESGNYIVNVTTEIGVIQRQVVVLHH